MQNIERSFDTDEIAIGGFYDNFGAFNNITYEGIKKGCLDHGIDERIPGWIGAMLKSSIVIAQAGQCSIRVKVSKGYPPRRSAITATMVPSSRRTNKRTK